MPLTYLLPRRTAGGGSWPSLPPLAEGCNYIYNVYTTGNTTDNGNSGTRFPMPVVRRGEDEMCVTWAEQGSDGVYGCRFDGCTKLQVGTEILDDAYQWRTPIEQSASYMWGEDKVIHTCNTNGGIKGVIVDASDMTYLNDVTITNNSYELHSVHAFENGFTLFTIRFGSSYGLYKANYDHFGTNTGSLTRILQSSNGTFRYYYSPSCSHKLNDDDSGYIFHLYYDDYGSKAPNYQFDGRVMGTITTAVGATVNSTVDVYSTPGYTRELPACVTQYREDPDGDVQGFLTFYWEGSADFSYNTGYFTMKRWNRSGGGMPSEVGELNKWRILDNSSGFWAGQNYISACEMHDYNTLIILRATNEWLYYLIIDPREEDIIAGPTRIINGYMDRSGMYEVVKAEDGVSYYIHYPYDTTPDKNRITRLYHTS